MSRREGRPPSVITSAPRTAIIAPLSVHRPGRGVRRAIPCCAARSASSWRSRPLAATPPPISRSVAPVAAQASTALALSTSQTASWKLAATSASGTGSPSRCRDSTQRATAVFSPEKEKLNRLPLQVAAAGEPAREGDVGRVPGGHPVDVRPARVGQAEHPGHLVVRLAGGVVDGGAQLGDPGGDAVHPEQRGVPARDQQRHAGGGQRAVLEQVDGHVTGEVVDPVERLVQRVRQGLGTGQPHDERPHQTRSGGDRDPVDLGQIDVGRGAGSLQGRHHGLEVGPAGHLGHHPAEPDVLRHAGGDLVGQQRVTADDADPGLVARGLDAEHQGPVARRCRVGREVVELHDQGVLSRSVVVAPAPSAARSRAAGRARWPARWCSRPPGSPPAPRGGATAARPARTSPAPTPRRRYAGATTSRCRSASSPTVLNAITPTGCWARASRIVRPSPASSPRQLRSLHCSLGSNPARSRARMAARSSWRADRMPTVGDGGRGSVIGPVPGGRGRGVSWWCSTDLRRPGSIASGRRR